jgi:acetyl-CoA decarbonylase/synthase complex subunit delta
MDPTTGALGYGIEYTYSIMERLRIAALTGDKICAIPMIGTPGEEVWKLKEAKVAEGVPQAWGNIEERALIWEELTAAALLHSGADILYFRHPRAAELIKATIDKLEG